MNAENSVDLFVRGRMGTVAEGVASLLEGREPPSSSVERRHLRGLRRAVRRDRSPDRRDDPSAAALRRRRLPPVGSDGRSRTGLALALNLGWALLVLVLLPKQFGVPLLTLAQGLPDLAYVLLASGVVALGWGVSRTVWAYFAFRQGGGVRLTASPPIAQLP